MRSLYTITDPARELDVTTRTLCFDEQEGWFEPMRRGRTRRYRPADRARLKLIPPGEPAQRGHRIARIAEKRAELEATRRDISQTLRELDPVGPAVGNGSKP